MSTKPELLIPAGSLTKIKIAYAYGADAVYVGASGLSMRPDQTCLSVEELATALNIAHQQEKKLYVAINSLMFEADCAHLEDWLETTSHLDFDAVIVADFGALSLVRQKRPDLNIHASTQLSTANAHAVNLLASLGIQRVNMARECSLADIKNIAQKTSLELEVFVHGAMCMAVSGRCLLSAHLCGESASQGRCKHTCRWDWQLVESKRPGLTLPVFETSKETIFLGSKDLCMIEHIPELVKSSISALKVEGRMKGEYYIASVTRVYRAALDAYFNNPAQYLADPNWLVELTNISHRDYETGFFFGYPYRDLKALQTNSTVKATYQVLAFIETIDNDWYTIATRNPFSVSDDLEWFAPNMQNGHIAIDTIIDSQEQKCDKVISGASYKVRFKDHPTRLPLWSFLHKKRP
ncbi:MAG: U32 family peptidase C-terminal domain-containing protein [Deltaproteobacteria bacterium]|nr:U32 family peptidase C-terminal domain-containing protein [Deltaproteobacteria bacterium]